VKAFLKGCTGIKQLKNKVFGLLGYQVKQILLSERGHVPFIHDQNLRPCTFKRYRQTIKQIRRYFCALVMV